ncbi:hypothetical protein STEG23_006616 [Scotinomys teguina]
MAEAPSQVLQNHDRDLENALNTHIQLQFQVSYVYLSMALYFDRDDVALGYFKDFFLSKSHNCKDSAEKFMLLQNKRGGHVFLPSISKPDCDSWSGGLRAMEYAVHMEMTINQSLLNLHELAKGKGDADLCSFLELPCLDEQVHVLQKMSGHLTNLCQMEDPEPCLAEYLFDKLNLS